MFGGHFRDRELTFLFEICSKLEQFVRESSYTNAQVVVMVCLETGNYYVYYISLA